MSRRAKGSQPFIFVLAGVNGAGKSSVGGAMLEAHGLAWFNPDWYARDLMREQGLSLDEANGLAWQNGRERLEAAIRNGANHAFETTLGANTITRLLIEAATTHRVVMIFVGLAAVEQHIARVSQRVMAGGHDIPALKIRERWQGSRLNLIKLLPHLAQLQVFDNSAEAPQGEEIPDPLLVLDMKAGKVLFPGATDASALAATPGWARAIVQAALEQSVGTG